jgi:hypothetical protein
VETVTSQQDLRQYTVVTLGKGSPESTGLWLESGFVSRVVHFTRAAPSGLRFGSRAWGMGVDSLLVALKVVVLRVRGPILATNPWVGAALRLLGRRDVAVTGIYATAGSRSHRLLRKALGRSAVITTVDLEAEAWEATGGRAISIRYGNTFDYPLHVKTDAQTLRVFIGGSSDRDSEVMDRLEREVVASDRPVHLTVVAGGEPSSWTNERSTIERVGWIANRQFGQRLSNSDVVFLPLLPGQRAAGHMVTVGSLEAGVPVVTTASEGMNGYIDGQYVTSIDVGHPLLPQLERRATGADPTAIRAYWADVFSRPAYVSRIGAALVSLNGTSFD